MKNIIIDSLKQLIDHRRLLVVLVLLVLLAISVSTYIAITIEVSDLRIITHYSAYGVTHFYRDSWVYLVSFVVFILLSAGFAVGICLKLLRQDREELALLFGWVSVALICITLVTYLHIAELV